MLLSVRLPRVLLAVAVGAAMGLAGLVSQTVFRNPLASPYVMGVSNGAAVGAVAGCSLGGNAAVQRGDDASGRAQAEREKESFKVFPIGRVQVNTGLPRDHLRRRHLLDPLTKPHGIGLWLGDNVRRQVAPSQEPLADND